MQDFSPDSHRVTPALVLALALLGALAFGGAQVWKQWRMAPGTIVPTEALTAKSSARNNDMRPESVTAPPAGPGWELLDTPQKLALYPLAPRWAVLSEQQKRSWLAIAQGFPALPAAEQERLHNRMTDWASLSAQQRSQARLNYAVTKKWAPDNKRAQWEAYQALSEAEKARLAEVAARRTMGAATAVHPVASRKLAKVPAAANGNVANPPKIPITPEGPQHRGSDVGNSSSLDTPKRPLVVETAPVNVPTAVPEPLPPLAPPSPPAEATPQPAMSPDMASQYSH